MNFGQDIIIIVFNTTCMMLECVHGNMACIKHMVSFKSPNVQKFQLITTSHVFEGLLAMFVT